MVPEVIGLIAASQIASAVASATPAFDPNLELHPDPGFDNPGAASITGTGLAVTGSQVVASSTSNGAHIDWTPAATLTPGTYLFTIDTATVVNLGGVNVSVGGVGGFVVTNPTGPHSVSIVVASVTSQAIRVGNFLSGKSGSWNSISVKQTA